MLASGFAVGLAAASGRPGLTDDVGSGLSGDGAERSLALSLYRQDGPLRDGSVTDLSETRAEWDEAAFDAALNGIDSTLQYRKPFFSTPEDPVYARRNGTHYRLGSVVVDEHLRPRHPAVRLPIPAEHVGPGDARRVRRVATCG